MTIRSKLLLGVLFYIVFALVTAITLWIGKLDIEQTQQSSDHASLLVKDIGELGLLSYDYLRPPMRGF